ncbi:WXG100 family type VII secretion target [Mycobacterium vicinigordonae]|uniref:ESAT-6-like protein n=1 Tax=Mycobacterium vicinigordonae TaxID=1719132 RepID=A0A7D6E2V2_9MYCO|nr:WXG100 family type VII secretion target [Mycobacterium vicinigordonae]QLL08401.1 WXG100 family type VII secretion target [Mycobacterium vicinigordonae]
MISYDFAAIEHSIRQDIHTTSARLNAAVEELRSLVVPLQQLWTREAAAAYQAEQLRWQQSISALNHILVELGNAVRDGAAEVADADRRAAGSWGRF